MASRQAYQIHVNTRPIIVFDRQRLPVVHKLNRWVLGFIMDNQLIASKLQELLTRPREGRKSEGDATALSTPGSRYVRPAEQRRR